MVEMITEYCKLRRKVSNKAKLYLDGAGTIEYFFDESMDETMVFSVKFVKGRKVTAKTLSGKEIIRELSQKSNYKMVLISVREEEKPFVFKALNEVSKVKGYSDPIVEVEKAIMYFPKLRYSDLGLLKYLCDRSMNDYRILLASGN